MEKCGPKWEKCEKGLQCVEGSEIYGVGKRYHTTKIRASHVVSFLKLVANFDYTKDFIIYSFASKDNIIGILMQKDNEGNNRPITFMSKPLQDVEARYTITEKQAYALIKSLKYFRVYVRHNKIYAYVPYPNMKYVLSQTECLGSRGKWVIQNTRI